MPKEMTVDERIASIIEPLKEEREALLEDQEEIKSELAEVTLGIRRLEKIIRDADPDALPAKQNSQVAKNNGQGKKGRRGVSEERIELVRKEVLKQKGEFSPPSIGEALGIPTPSVQAALHVLRDQGLVVFTGERRREGAAGGRTTRHYRPVKARG